MSVDVTAELLDNGAVVLTLSAETAGRLVDALAHNCYSDTVTNAVIGACADAGVDENYGRAPFRF